MKSIGSTRDWEGIAGGSPDMTHIVTVPPSGTLPTQ